MPDMSCPLSRGSRATLDSQEASVQPCWVAFLFQSAQTLSVQSHSIWLPLLCLTWASNRGQFTLGLCSSIWRLLYYIGMSNKSVFFLLLICLLPVDHRRFNSSHQKASRKQSHSLYIIQACFYVMSETKVPAKPPTSVWLLIQKLHWPLIYIDVNLYRWCISLYNR